MIDQVLTWVWLASPRLLIKFRMLRINRRRESNTVVLMVVWGPWPLAYWHYIKILKKRKQGFHLPWMSLEIKDLTFEVYWSWGNDSDVSKEIMPPGLPCSSPIREEETTSSKGLGALEWTDSNFPASDKCDLKPKVEWWVEDAWMTLALWKICWKYYKIGKKYLTMI